MRDAIAAIATPAGYSGVGIIRISGHDIISIARTITKLTEITPRYAHYCSFYEKDEAIDNGLVIFFPAPNSFTGEDVIEFQGHGSPVCLSILLQTCCFLGCRLATAGEFSKRAFLNGKIDLLQAQSIVNLIHAESIISARSAINTLNGSLSNKLNIIMKELINLRIYVEAHLDFPEEELDIPTEDINTKLSLIKSSILRLMPSLKNGLLLNNGVKIVIVGAPNAGKSSVLNAIAEDDISIISDISGTTRDIIKHKIIINGIKFDILDTAGINLNTEDKIEIIGIERALNALKTADICMVIIDSSVGIQNKILESITNHITTSNILYVYNKIDIPNALNLTVLNPCTRVSALKLIGINELKDKLLELIGWNPAVDGLSTNIYNLDAIKRTVATLNVASSLELLAHNLTISHDELAKIVGGITNDELLGTIFSKFCIGK